MNFCFAFPLWVHIDGDGDFLDGAAIDGSSIFEVVERGNEISIVAAIGVDSHVGTKLVAKMGDAVEGGNVKVDTLIVHLAHGGDVVFIATGKDERQRTNQ